MSKKIILNILILNIVFSSVLYAQVDILLNNKADSLLKSQPVEKEFSFVVFGDAQRWDTLHLVAEAFAEMLIDIKNNPVKPKFAIMLGDFVYSGTHHQYDTFYNLVSNWMDTTGIAFFCLPGNHNFSGTVGYNNYLKFIDEDLDYYFDYDNYRFILIDNVNSTTSYNYRIKPEQITKIEEWLNTAPDKIFSFAHISLVRSEHLSGMSNPGYTEYLYALQNAGFSAHFNGHIHDYHRTKYNNVYHITTAGAGGYQIGTYNPPYTYDNHHWLLVNVDACQGVSVNMYRHNYGNDSIAQQYDFQLQPSSPITINSQIKNVSCYDGIDGSISITAENGVAPGNYSFNWSNAATTSDVNYLHSGNYTVTVTDTTGCYAVASFALKEPEEIIPFALTQDVLCAGGNDGKIEIMLLGGTPPFTYKWSNGSTSKNIANLYTGLYHLTVSDSNFCEAVISATIDEPPALIVNSVVIPDTNGQCLASIALNVTGGNAPYFYSWSNDFSIQSSCITDICFGSYYVTVTDFNGCSKVLYFDVNDIWQSIDDINISDNVFISPNPADDFINITLPYDVSGDNINVKLIDIYGKIHFNKIFVNSSNDFLFELPANSKGLFFVDIQTSKGVAIKKILIQ